MKNPIYGIGMDILAMVCKSFSLFKVIPRERLYLKAFLIILSLIIHQYVPMHTYSFERKLQWLIVKTIWAGRVGRNVCVQTILSPYYGSRLVG